MDVPRSSKIFEFAKVIGTVNGLSPHSVSRVIPPQSDTSPSASSVSSTSSSDTSSEGDTSPKVKQSKIWKGKTTII